ncbi:MAG: hypothetical protein QOC89_4326 [Paraburkholderia sp.]|nr:hypothetical protein [Paraburkholderia sp.]
MLISDPGERLLDFDRYCNCGVRFNPVWGAVAHLLTEVA